MTRFACIFAIFILAVCAQADSYFADAREAYDAGKFADAKRIYEEGLRTNADANLFINHGNACFRLGDNGRAILSYERALVASPSHPDAAENLKFVRNRAGARVEDPGWRERILTAIPRRAAPWVATSVAWFGCAWAAMAFARRRVLGLVAGGMLIALGATYAAGLVWMEKRRSQTAIVVVAKAEARNEPLDRATIAETLPAGSRVREIGQRGAWKYCELPSGGRGWLPAETTERIFQGERS
jgi:tetratricopeptide (TPR) repeat protein